MDVTFKDQSLDRLETDAALSARGFGDAIVKAYRKSDAAHPRRDRRADLLRAAVVSL